ncbi:MAG TPA: hypothetical protein VFA60_14435 [Terriglobales bacterium]|nr:hypothetical protein [Terriglobales bacterium]
MPTKKPGGRLVAADAAPRCQHIRVTGARCGSPAIALQDYCYYHQRLRDDHAPQLPLIEDAASIQLAIQQVLRGLNTGMMEYKVAALMLYGLQTAASNVLRVREEWEAACAQLGDFDALPSAVRRARLGAAKHTRRLPQAEPVSSNAQIASSA